MSFYSSKKGRKNYPYTVNRGVTFALIALTVIVAVTSIYSFIEIKSIKENHKSNISQLFTIIQLLNELQYNLTSSRQYLLEHNVLSTFSGEAVHSRQIRENGTRRAKALKELSEGLKPLTNEELLGKLITSNKAYFTVTDSLVQLRKQHKLQEAETFRNTHLEPAYQNYQFVLADLTKQVHQHIQAENREVQEHLNDALMQQALLIAVALIVVGIAIVLYRIALRKQQTKDFLVDEKLEKMQQLERALSESKKQYQVFFHKNPIPMWVFDQDTYRFLKVNEAAQREYGYTEDEFLQKTLLDIRPKEDNNETIKRLIEISKEEFASSLRRHMRKDGSIFYVEVNSYALPEDDNTNTRLVAAVNVHESIEALKKLYKQEKLLKEVSSSIPGVVYQFQINKNQESSFTFISEGIYNILDLNPKEAYLSPELLFKNIHPEDATLVKESINYSYINLTPWELEFRVKHPTKDIYIWLRGHSIPTNGEDGTVTWNGTFIDITKLKEAQVQLIESEASLHALLDSSPQAIFSLDRDLNITKFNAVAAREIKRYFLKELSKGQKFLDFIVPEQKQCIIDSHANALRGRKIRFEAAVNDFYYDIAFRPILSKDSEVLAVSLIMNDVSEHKNAIKTIKESEAQLARAQELAKMGNFEYNIINGTLAWSDGVYKVFGESPETYIPSLLGLIQHIHPDDRHTFEEEIKKVSTNKIISSLEYSIVLGDGTSRYVYQISEPILNTDGKVVKISGLVQDITDRKLAEREIIEAKDSLQSTIENVPEIIFTFNKSLQLIYVSPQSLEITGYSEEDYMNNEELWLDNMYPEDRDQFLNYTVPNLQAGKKQQQEVRIINRAGQIKWLLLRISPMKNDRGNIFRFDGSAADMTQYKVTETKRNQLTEQLLRQNQNLQQFAYIVSHNLRAPIANILGLTSIYDRANAEAPMNQRVIDGLTKSAQLLDSTIQDLNDILSIRNEENLVKEKISFEDVLNDVLESISERVKDADASIKYNFSQAPTVVSVRSYIYSIIQNLVTNAIKYRSPNRKLHLHLNTIQNGDYICLHVADNGSGIDLIKEKDKIFGLYKRFHSNVAGKGIGLHLVKTQAEMLGGKVEVESEVNVGTTFKVYIKA